MATGTPLAVLPLGTANDLARNLDLPGSQRSAGARAEGKVVHRPRLGQRPAFPQCGEHRAGVPRSLRLQGRAKRIGGPEYLRVLYLAYRRIRRSASDHLRRRASSQTRHSRSSTAAFTGAVGAATIQLDHDGRSTSTRCKRAATGDAVLASCGSRELRATGFPPSGQEVRIDEPAPAPGQYRRRARLATPLEIEILGGLRWWHHAAMMRKAAGWSRLKGRRGEDDLPHAQGISMRGTQGRRGSSPTPPQSTGGMRGGIFPAFSSTPHRQTP
jgi:hypothetical protein